MFRRALRTWSVRRPPPNVSAVLRELGRQIPRYQGDHARLVDRLDHQLGSLDVDTAVKRSAFDSTLYMLMKSRHYADAISLFQGMLARSLPPFPTTNATIAGLAIAASGASEADLLNALSVTMEDPHYSEKSLMLLLDYMAQLGSSTSFRMQVARQFLESRPEGTTPSMALVSRLVMLQARDGMLKQSLDWIVRDDDKPKPKPPPPKQANVYAGLLQHIKANDTKNAAAVDTVLAHMKQNNVPVNTNVFNALIGIQLRRGNISQAFSLYDVLVKLSRTQPIRPDASTFASLFSAIQLLRTSRLRTARNRRLKDADNILHPRFLFRDLVYCDATAPLDKRHAPPTPIITPSLLNLALRTFLSLKDTAAAYVVVRSFNVLRLQPNIATHYIVLKLLMDRLRYDLWRARRSGESRWGDYMLGISWKEVPSVKVDDALAEKVLAIGGPHRNMPTLQQIDGDQSLPEGMILDTLPLERILKRAVHAEVSVAVNSSATSRLVSDALRKAKQDMLPPKQALSNKS